MATIEPFRPGDRHALDALLRRTAGPDAAEADRLRWDWQYARNPNNPAAGPRIWVAREGPAIVGELATMPVRLRVLGTDVQGSWATRLVVARERRRQGLGELLFGAWDSRVGASLGLGLADEAAPLFERLRWPQPGPVPCLVKPLTRRAFRRPHWPAALNRLVSAVTHPVVRIIARARPLRGETVIVRYVDARFSEFWERVKDRFTFIAHRDATYLQWRYLALPHVRYSIVAVQRGNDVTGFAVFRHARDPHQRVTLLVDFLTDPADDAAFDTLVRYVDRAARDNDSDQIRTFCLDRRFRTMLSRNGYFETPPGLAFAARINARHVPADFYRDTAAWHVTLGDSDQDR